MKWIPGSKTPSENHLAGPVLDREVEQVEVDIKATVAGKIGTGQCDGWKSISKMHIVGSMVNVENEPYLVHTHNVSDKPKTGDTLLDIVLADITYCLTYLKIIIAAWCTDAGSDAASMRRKLKERLPWIIVLDCWAHQINLIVGDYFKIKLPWISQVDMALELIKWFNNHSYALGLLRAQQLNSGKVALILILPVLTHWISHFLALDRLLELKRAIRACVDMHYDALVKSAGKKDAQEKAKQILVYVHMEAFWGGIEKVRNDLHPLAVAANILQASTTRLDQVLLTLANLYRLFSDPSVDPDVLFLNPYLRNRAFRSGNPALTPCALYDCAIRVFNRVFQHDIDTGFHMAFWDYISEKAEFSPTRMALDRFKKAHKQSDTPLNIVAIWSALDNGSSEAGRNGLVKLAIRILSIIANSADTERVFSDMGLEQTKLRNCLTVERLRKRVMVKMNIKRLHKTHGLRRDRKKRKFEALSSHTMNSVSSSTPPLILLQANNAPIMTHLSMAALAEDLTSHPELDDISDELTADECFVSIINPLIADADADAIVPPPPAVTGEVSPQTILMPSAPHLQVPRDEIPMSEALLLENMFNFDAPDLLGFCWHGGAVSLHAEGILYESMVASEINTTI
ncbi:ribonuclease H-like domain-containing protein [Sparassis latifolia]